MGQRHTTPAPPELDRQYREYVGMIDYLSLTQGVRPGREEASDHWLGYCAYRDMLASEKKAKAEERRALAAERQAESVERIFDLLVRAVQADSNLDLGADWDAMMGSTEHTG